MENKDNKSANSNESSYEEKDSNSSEQEFKINGVAKCTEKKRKMYDSLEEYRKEKELFLKEIISPKTIIIKIDSSSDEISSDSAGNKENEIV